MSFFKRNATPSTDAPSPVAMRAAKLIKDQREIDGRQTSNLSERFDSPKKEETGSAITVSEGSTMEINGRQSCNFIVHGTLNGTFDLDGTITIIGSAAKVEGDVICHSMTIVDGGDFSGTLKTNRLRVDEFSKVSGELGVAEIIAKPGSRLNVSIKNI